MTTSFRSRASAPGQKATFAASGFDLAVVGVGPPESGAKFCDKAAFPAENLYVDPSREVYDALGCYHGLARTFFNKATPNAIVARGMDQFKGAPSGFNASRGFEEMLRCLGLEKVCGCSTKPGGKGR